MRIRIFTLLVFCFIWPSFALAQTSSGSATFNAFMDKFGAEFGTGPAQGGGTAHYSENMSFIVDSTGKEVSFPHLSAGNASQPGVQMFAETHSLEYLMNRCLEISDRHPDADTLEEVFEILEEELEIDSVLSNASELCIDKEGRPIVVTIQDERGNLTTTTTYSPYLMWELTDEINIAPAFMSDTIFDDRMGDITSSTRLLGCILFF